VLERKNELLRRNKDDIIRKAKETMTADEREKKYNKMKTESIFDDGDV
jgi:hypothetical protein